MVIMLSQNVIFTSRFAVINRGPSRSVFRLMSAFVIYPNSVNWP